MNFVRLIVEQDKSISRGLSITSEVFSISQVSFFIPSAALRHAPPYPVQPQPPLKTLRNSLSAHARAFTKTDSLQNQVEKESAFSLRFDFLCQEIIYDVSGKFEFGTTRLRKLL